MLASVEQATVFALKKQMGDKQCVGDVKEENGIYFAFIYCSTWNITCLYTSYYFFILLYTLLVVWASHFELETWITMLLHMPTCWNVQRERESSSLFECLNQKERFQLWHFAIWTLHQNDIYNVPLDSLLASVPLEYIMTRTKFKYIVFHTNSQKNIFKIDTTILE